MHFYKQQWVVFKRILKHGFSFLEFKKRPPDQLCPQSVPRCQCTVLDNAVGHALSTACAARPPFVEEGTRVRIANTRVAFLLGIQKGRQRLRCEKKDNKVSAQIQTGPLNRRHGMAFALVPLSRRIGQVPVLCWRRLVGGSPPTFYRERVVQQPGLRAAAMSAEAAGDAKRARRDEISSSVPAAGVAAAAATAAGEAGAASVPGGGGGGSAPRYDVDYVAATPESLRATLGEPVVPNPLQLRVDGQDGRARACTISLPHGVVHTPVFMPVGTKGTIKCLTSEQVEAAPLDCEIILGNTYVRALCCLCFLARVGGVAAAAAAATAATAAATARATPTPTQAQLLSAAIRTPARTHAPARSLAR